MPVAAWILILLAWGSVFIFVDSPSGPLESSVTAQGLLLYSEDVPAASTPYPVTPRGNMELSPTAPSLTAEAVPTDIATPSPVKTVFVLADGVLAVEAVGHILRSVGFPESEIMNGTIISQCESKHSPDAINGVMRGMFQISDRSGSWPGWWEYFGYDVAKFNDPYYNAALAYEIWSYRGRWGGEGGWTCADLNGIY